MFNKIVLSAVCALCFASPGFALERGQAVTPSECIDGGGTVNEERGVCLIGNAEFCEDEANRDDPICLGLPPAGGGTAITNFAPLIAPILGAGIVAGLANSSTSSTTSTTD